MPTGRKLFQQGRPGREGQRAVIGQVIVLRNITPFHEIERSKDEFYRHRIA